MPTINAESLSPQLVDSLRHLQKLRNFDGESGQFWRVFLEALISITGADAGLICRKVSQDAAPWKTLASGPNDPQSQTICTQLARMVPMSSKQCADSGYACLPLGDSSVIAVNLMVDVEPQNYLAIFYLGSIDSNEAALRINALLAVRDIPAQYYLNKSAYDALKMQSKLSDILDVLAIMNSQHRFMAAAMTVCNELANRYSCDRVSLGWIKKGYIRIRAMSHTDQFEKKMEVVEKLELAMEEAMDQDADISFPTPETSICITRDHEAYTKAQDVKFMVTLPIREKGKIVALVSAERNNTPFADIHLRQLRITIDQLSTRLIELRGRDRWFGARLTDSIRKLFGHLVGYEHTWPKVFAVLGTALLCAMTFIPAKYRVSSPMILRTDDILFITAPFDGYIDSVGFKPGELVEANATLLLMDNNDLILEEAALLAEKNREQREIEKARAAEELADMLISQARYDQIIAKLDINRYRQQQATIIAPYEGIIIEGDQQEKIGSPVRQGEILFKIGRIKDIYAEAKVSEAEIQNIRLSSGGQIALASRPQDLFDMNVTLIEPSAVVTEKDNVFLVRCKFRNAVPPWFRPGMTGISKIDVGKKSFMWIISHRTIDFIRLKFWW